MTLAIRKGGPSATARSRALWGRPARRWLNMVGEEDLRPHRPSGRATDPVRCVQPGLSEDSPNKGLFLISRLPSVWFVLAIGYLIVLFRLQRARVAVEGEGY